MKRPVLAALGLAAALAATASAQDAGQPASAPAAPPPPCEGALFHAFDFWIGEWDVTTPKGQFAGTNSITRAESGCLLIERWNGAKGSTGQSYNFVDLETGKWRQVWVSPGATIDYSGGLNDKGEMVLEGTIGYGAGQPGNGAKFKGTWTPNDDGTVTQHFEQYDDARKQWNDWFVGIYTRKTE